MNRENWKFKNEDLLFYLIFIIFSVLFFYPCLIYGKAPFFRDITSYYFPIIESIKKTFLEYGEMPLWNPYIFCGTPQMAGLDPSIFYPSTILFLLFPFPDALNWNIFLHHILAGIGMYALTKHWKFSFASRLIAAFSFAFSGYMLSLSNNLLSLLFACSWLPLLMLQLDYLLISPTLKNIILLGSLGAIQILISRPDVTYFMCLMLFLYAVAYISNKAKVLGTKQTLKCIGLLISSGILALILSSLVLFPWFEFGQLSVRKFGIPLNEATMWSLMPWQLISFFVPKFFGDQFYGSPLFALIGAKEMGYALYILNIYMAMSTIFFALLSIFLISNNKRIFFWFFILSIFGLFSLGDSSIVFPFSHEFIPGVSFFRYPVKAFIISTFAIAILASYGFDLSIKKINKLSSFLFYMLSISFILAIFGIIAYIYPLPFIISLFDFIYDSFKVIIPVNTLFKPYYNILSQCWLALEILSINIFFLFLWYRQKIKQNIYKFIFILIILIDLFLNGQDLLWLTPHEYFKTYLNSPIAQYLNTKEDKKNWRFIKINKEWKKSNPFPENFFSKYPIEHRTWAGLIYFMTIMEGDMNIFYNLYNFWGYSAAVLQDYMIMYYTSIPIKKINSKEYVQFLSIFGIKYLIVYHKQFSSLNKKYYILEKTIPDLGIDIWKVKETTQRVYFRTKSLVSSHLNAPLDAILGKIKTFSHNNMVALLKDPQYLTAQQKIPRKSPVDKTLPQPSIIDETPNTITIKITTKSSGYLVLADTYYPGWKAYDNDKETPILRANFIIRAIKLGAGEHVVKFIYKSLSFEIGLLLSVIGWVGVLMFLIGVFIFENFSYKKYN